MPLRLNAPPSPTNTAPPSGGFVPTSNLPVFQPPSQAGGGSIFGGAGWTPTQTPLWGGRPVADPLNLPDRISTAPLEQMRMDPNTLYQLRLNPIFAEARDSERAFAEDAARGRLGPGAVADFRRRLATQTAGLASQARGASVIDANTFNQAVLTNALQALIQQRGQDIGFLGDVSSFFTNLLAASQA